MNRIALFAAMTCLMAFASLSSSALTVDECFKDMAISLSALHIPQSILDLVATVETKFPLNGEMSWQMGDLADLRASLHSQYPDEECHELAAEVGHVINDNGCIQILQEADPLAAKALTYSAIARALKAREACRMLA